MHKTLIPLLSLAVLAWAVWPEKGYTDEERLAFNELVKDNTDWDAIPRLSVADLGGME